MSNLRESQKHETRLMYWEVVCRRIMYNHHRTGPAGTVNLHAAPFRDPVQTTTSNPMIVTGIDLVSSAMHHPLPAGRQARLSTMRSGLVVLDVGGTAALRTTAYFQNIIGPADRDHRQSDGPMQIPPVEGMILPRARSARGPSKTAGPGTFRQSIDYSVTANYFRPRSGGPATRTRFLYNIYKMGSNQIARGLRRNHWTISEEDHRAVLDARGGPPAGKPRPAAAGWSWRSRVGRGAVTRRLPAPDRHGVRGTAGRGLSLTTYTSVMKDPSPTADPARVSIVTGRPVPTSRRRRSSSTTPALHRGRGRSGKPRR